MDYNYQATVKIDVDSILEQFDCTICLCKLTVPTITKCGHTFCKQCIAEVINIKHKCPMCNQVLPNMQDNTSTNYALESLLMAIEKKKEDETKKYFDDLTNNSQVIDSQSKSPIELIFTKNLKESLLKFQKYSQDLNLEKEKEIEKVKKDSFIDENRKGIKVNEIAAKFTDAQKLLMEQYDSHMKDIMPEPKLMPVRVNVNIIRNGKAPIHLENLFQVKPYETIDNLISSLKELYEQKQDPITNWDLNKIVITGPIYSGSVDDPDMEMTAGGQVTQVGANGKVNIIDTTLNFAQIGVNVQLTNVYFYGDNIEFKSNKPLECLTLMYSKEDPEETKYNYWSCKTCNINWVCEWCKQGCHADHELLIHIQDHRPTYACCYCTKKNLCKIKNSKNTKKN